jgi:hypothetical protein
MSFFGTPDSFPIDSGMAEKIGLHPAVIYGYIKHNNINIFTYDQLTGLSGALSIVTIKRGLKVLENQGYIKKRKLTPEEKKSILTRNEANKESGVGTAVCSWCKCKTYSLHKHHYPTPRECGGKDIVLICPNCHCNFHAINIGLEIAT